MLARGSASLILSALAFSMALGYGSFYLKGILSPLSRALFIFSIPGFFLFLFFLVFFRDPDRKYSGPESDAVSPADGKVIKAGPADVSIFMGIYNVHVNRAPLAGNVKKIDYRPGGYIPAFNKDSEQNERNRVVIDTGFGEVEVTQIAGIITRRIVSYISEKNAVLRGERIGMIRFGSRVNVRFPECFEVVVSAGDHVKAGETVIARKKAGYHE